MRNALNSRIPAKQYSTRGGKNGGKCCWPTDSRQSINGKRIRNGEKLAYDETTRHAAWRRQILHF